LTNVKLEIKELSLSEIVQLDFYSEIIIDYQYLYGLLTTVYHWNNAKVGSLYFCKRNPVDHYYIDAYRFLNFFTIA
jgi:hypothetical protein